MNAHADMFIVVEHNELNTPRSIYRSLVSGERNFAGFLLTKTSANKRLLLCLLPLAADVQTSPAQVLISLDRSNDFFTVQRYYIFFIRARYCTKKSPFIV